MIWFIMVAFKVWALEKQLSSPGNMLQLQTHSIMSSGGRVQHFAFQQTLQVFLLHLKFEKYQCSVKLFGYLNSYLLLSSKSVVFVEQSGTECQKTIEWPLSQTVRLPASHFRVLGLNSWLPTAASCSCWPLKTAVVAQHMCFCHLCERPTVGSCFHAHSFWANLGHGRHLGEWTSKWNPHSPIPTLKT